MQPWHKVGCHIGRKWIRVILQVLEQVKHNGHVYTSSVLVYILIYILVYILICLNLNMRKSQWRCWYGIGFTIHRTRVKVSSPGWAPLRSGLWQATYTCVPLSPSSIIWYRPRGSDVFNRG